MEAYKFDIFEVSWWDVGSWVRENLTTLPGAKIVLEAIDDISLCEFVQSLSALKGFQTNSPKIPRSIPSTWIEDEI